MRFSLMSRMSPVKNEKNKSYLQTVKWHMTTHSADKQVYYVSITYSIHKVILR